MKYLANGAVFAITYIVFMIPTYILPYLGSNSSVSTVAIASQDGLILQTVMHLSALAVLVVITALRGQYVAKKWLVILPILAAVFDMTPGLNVIPLVPTVLHLFVLIKGVASSPTTDEGASA